MRLCIFNPEHDLCLAKGRAHYVPPRSAIEFARRDAAIMQVLYPDARCMSVYDPLLPAVLSGGRAFGSAVTAVTAWGWDAVVKHELLKHGCPEDLLPSDEDINTIRRLQHRSTILPLQPDCHEVTSIDGMQHLLQQQPHWVMKAPWSGAGRGLRWVHGRLTDIDRQWLLKTVDQQRCIIAEPNRSEAGDRSGASPSSVADVALEYRNGHFAGYSFFRTGSGVYKENVMWPDDMIVSHFSSHGLLQKKHEVEQWLTANVWPLYKGPLGVDLMVCDDGIHVAEINFRHTMGMVAHAKIASL